MKFIFAIGIVSTLANFKFSFRGAPLTHNYFVIGNRRNQNSTHLWQQVGTDHDKNVFSLVNGATNITHTNVNNDFPSKMSDGGGKWTPVEYKKGKAKGGTPLQGTPVQPAPPTEISSATTASPADIDRLDEILNQVTALSASVTEIKTELSGVTGNIDALEKSFDNTFLRTAVST